MSPEKKQVGWFFVRMVWVLCGLLTMALLVGCDKTDYPPNKRPSLHTTISADGKMVVTLDRAGEVDPLLTVFRLDNGVQVEKLPAPPYTYRIRFGLQGYELLIVHYVGDRHVADLLKWDLAKPQHPPEHIYRSIGSDFPLEVEPGLYLLKDCAPRENEPGQCQRGGGNRWRLVTSSGLQESFSDPRGILLYGWPNVVTGQGFVWTEERGRRRSPSAPPREFPLYLKVAYPDGPDPDTSHLETFGDETRRFICDYQARRCLRVFLTSWGEPGPYVYDVDVVFEGEQCTIDQGDWRFIERSSMTPDGRSAVLTVADGFAEPRRLVVLRFDEGQCTPTRVRTIYDQRSGK